MAYFEHYARGKKFAKEAVGHDQAHRYNTALKRYVEAASELLQSSRHDFDTRRRDACKAAAARYVKRAEILKKYLLRSGSTKPQSNPAQQPSSTEKGVKPALGKENKQQTTPASKDAGTETLKIPSNAVGVVSTPAASVSFKKESGVAKDTKSPSSASQSASPFVKPLTLTPRMETTDNFTVGGVDISSESLAGQQEEKKREKIMALLHQLKPHLRPGGTVSREANVTPPQNPEPRSLPLHWRMHTDPASGRPYYHNEQTNITTWDRPRSSGTTSSPPTYTSPAYTPPAYSPPDYTSPLYAQQRASEGAAKLNSDQGWSAKSQSQNRAHHGVGTRGSHSGGRSGGSVQGTASSLGPGTTAESQRRKGASSYGEKKTSRASGPRARRQLLVAHSKGNESHGAEAVPASVTASCLRLRVHCGRGKSVLHVAAGQPLQAVTSDFVAPDSSSGLDGNGGPPHVSGAPGTAPTCASSAEPKTTLWDVFCPSRGFLSLTESLTPALQVWPPRKKKGNAGSSAVVAGSNAGNTTEGLQGIAIPTDGSGSGEGDGVLLGILPGRIQREEQRACQALATIAREAGALLQGAYGLLDRRDKGPAAPAKPTAAGSPKERGKQFRVTQEKITRLLLRLDTVDISLWTRPLRKMQVKQLIAASKDIREAAKACGLD